nr:MAG TPA: hypothetical protein [Caudoviricetes sp.]
MELRNIIYFSMYKYNLKWPKLGICNIYKLDFYLFNFIYFYYLCVYYTISKCHFFGINK